MNLEGDTLVQIQKWWDAIFSNFWQYLSKIKSCPGYKYIRAEHHNISYFLLPLDKNPKFSTSKDNYEEFSTELIIHLVKDNTITPSKAQKFHFQLITYINNDNGFDLLIAVVFGMSSQRVVLGTKYQDLVISVCLVEGETFPQLHLRAFQIRSEIFLL